MAETAQKSIDIPDSGIKGEVSSNPGAGGVEAHIVAALALREAGELIAERIKRLGTQEKKIAVVTATEAASFQASSALAFGKALMTAACEVAKQSSKPPAAAPPPPVVAAAAPMAILGPSIELLTKIGSYFKTDYTFGAIDIALDEPLFVAAMVESLRAAGMEVFSPGLQAVAAENAAPKLLELMSDLAEMQANAKVQAESAAAQGNAKAAGAWQVVSTLYETFVAKLFVAESGTLPIARLALELRLREFAAYGSILIIKPHRLGGSTVTRKTIFSTFGICDPFTIGAGALLSYVLVKGNDASIQDSGVVPIMGEHYELRHVRQAAAAAIAKRG